MKLAELIALADPAYTPEEPGALLQYLDEKGNVLAPEKVADVERPDTLALFIVREIADVTRGEAPARQRELAADAMARAMRDLRRVEEAFHV